MSRSSSVVATSAVLAAVVAVGVAGSERPTPAVPAGRPVVRPVTSATLSCPGLPGAATPSTTVFAVGPDATAAPTDIARLKILGAGPGMPWLGGSGTVGTPARTRMRHAAGQTGVLVQGLGTQAPGVTAAEVSTYSSTDRTGIAAVACESPREDWWFSGVDTSVGTSTALVLANPSRTVAVVDLQIEGADGLVDAAGANGIPIGPESRVVLDLARYAPGAAAVTMHVAATRGSVAAAVSTTRLAGLTPVGADWVPASAPPSRTVLVDAGVGDVGRQSLVVTNTGSRQQVVSVRILDQAGAFTSTKLADLQVPPHSVVVKHIRGIVGPQPAAVELSAAGPLTGALVSRQLAGPRDFAVSGVGEVLTAPAVAPTIRATSMTLAFATSSPARQRVEVHGVTSSGAQAGVSTVDVEGSATTTWELPDDWEAAYLVVSVPAGSQLHCVATYSGTAGVTQLPLRSGRRTLLRPVVLPF